MLRTRLAVPARNRVGFRFVMVALMLAKPSTAPGPEFGAFAEVFAFATDG